MEHTRVGQRKGWTTSTPSAGDYKTFNDHRIFDRVRAAVRDAREVVEGYGAGRPVREDEVQTLLRACSMCVLRAELGVPADAWPPTEGVVYLFVDHSVGPTLLRYIQLHEIGHRLAGDLDEPTAFIFDGPLPEAEEVADLFALLGVLDAAEIAQGPRFVESRIRARVPLDNYGWQKYRVPRLAGKLTRLRATMED